LLDGELVLWVEQQFELLEINNPYSTYFSKYLKEHWLQKTWMWCIKNQSIPHAGQDTNTIVESFHTNMK
jgi:hypothetical protein